MTMILKNTIMINDYCGYCPCQAAQVQCVALRLEHAHDGAWTLLLAKQLDF